MPVPTEVLDEDIKELKADVRDIRADLGVLKADVHRIDVSLAELRSDVRSAIGLGKWAGTVLLTALLTSGLGAVIWGARLDARVSDRTTTTRVPPPRFARRSPPARSASTP